MRPPNLVTAAADILAGAAVAGAVMPVAWLVPASVCLYAGGVVLNDVMDRDLDARERPERPLPSGAASLQSASLLAAGLLLAGVALASLGSLASARIGVALACCVVAYDAALKRHAVAGPLAMGSCRALNLLLGISACPQALGTHGWLAAVPLLYVAAVTRLSRGEVGGGRRRTSAEAMALMVASLLLLALFPAPHRWLLAIFAAVLAARVGKPFWDALVAPEEAAIRRAVQAGVLSLILLDATIAAGFSGVLAALAILSLRPLAGTLAGRFAVT